MILEWFLSNSQWFLSNSWAILEWFLVILGNSQVILGWFLSNSQWFLTILKWFLVILKQFLNDSQMILSDSQAILFMAVQFMQILTNLYIIWQSYSSSFQICMIFEDAYWFAESIIPWRTLLLSARTAMWSMPVVLTKTENENDIAKMMVQKWCCKMTSQALTTLFADGIISDYSLVSVQTPMYSTRAFWKKRPIGQVYHKGRKTSRHRRNVRSQTPVVSI